MERAFTETQGQYLAFIHYYTKLHGVPPAMCGARSTGTEHFPF